MLVGLAILEPKRGTVGQKLSIGKNRCIFSALKANTRFPAAALRVPGTLTKHGEPLIRQQMHQYGAPVNGACPVGWLRYYCPRRGSMGRISWELLCRLRRRASTPVAGLASGGRGGRGR